MAKVKIVRNLLLDAERSMTGIDSARLDAEILLAICMKTDRASLYAWPEQEVADNVAVQFHLLVNKRREKYPLAYLLGKKEFWSMQLNVDQRTLIPRPETECLVETALEIIPAHQPYAVLDMGTGSGAIALAIASERTAAKVLATDISEAALAIATGNARAHGIANIEFLRSDWFTDLQGRQFDMIVANPPYVESSDSGFICGEIKYEPRQALDGGEYGMQAIIQLVQGARNFLKPKGHLLIEHGCQQAKNIHDLFLAGHYREIQSRHDYAGLDRLSFAQRA